MKPAPFTYFRPSNVAEMLEILAKHGEDGKVLAGGQSLVAAMNFRLARPSILFDANDLHELEYLRKDGDLLRVGALTRHAAFHRPVVETPLGTLLATVVSHIAHYPIRQRGTFGGSLVHADPAAEWCLVATTLDAEIVIRNRESERVVRPPHFFRGIFSTDLKSNELVTEIRLPLLGADWHTGFYEFARRAGDFALAMSLVALRVIDGHISEARLGLGGVSDRAIRLNSLEQQLIGHAPSMQLCSEIGEAAREAVEPIADIHGSKEYRRDLIGTVVSRALASAIP